MLLFKSFFYFTPPPADKVLKQYLEKNFEAIKSKRVIVYCWCVGVNVNVVVVVVKCWCLKKKLKIKMKKKIIELIVEVNKLSLLVKRIKLLV